MEKLTVDENTSGWWARLDEAQRLLAEEEARRYEGLSDKERDSIWKEEADSPKLKPRVTRSTFQQEQFNE